MIQLRSDFKRILRTGRNLLHRVGVGDRQGQDLGQLRRSGEWQLEAMGRAITFKGGGWRGAHQKSKTRAGCAEAQDPEITEGVSSSMPLPSAVWAPPGSRCVVCTPRILPEESSPYIPKPCPQVCWQTGVPQVFWAPQERTWCPRLVSGMGRILGYSVRFSYSVVSNSLQSRGLRDARLPCPSLSPKVCSNSCPLSLWCQPKTKTSDKDSFLSFLKTFHWLQFIWTNIYWGIALSDTLPDSSVFYKVNFWGISFRYKGKRHLFPTVFSLGFGLNLIEKGERLPPWGRFGRKCDSRPLGLIWTPSKLVLFQSWVRSAQVME